MENNYPSILDRIKSTSIDTIILIAIFYLTSDILKSIDNVPNWTRTILFISFLLYEPIFVSINGTFGNHKRSIRVRKNNDTSKRINFIQSFFRYFFKIFLGWFSLLFILINPKGRALHDIICGSVMIKVED